MIDKLLREPKEVALTPIALTLPRTIQPLTLTLAALGVGLAAAAAIWQQAYGLGLALWAVNRVLDGLDGTLARVQRRQSDLGGYIDILADTAIYALIPAALVLGRPSTAGWVSLVALLSSFYLNGASWMYLAALLEKRGQGGQVSGELTTITMPSGLIEGAETVLFYTLFLLLPHAAVALFWAMALLVVVTIGQRLVWARRHL